MGKLHEELEDPQIHEPKGFGAALINTKLAKLVPNGSEWTENNVLPSALSLADSTAAPPTEVLTDIYLLDRTGVTLDVDTIAWQSGTTVRISFNGTPDLSGVTIGDTYNTSGNGNTSNDGIFDITDVNDGADYIEITNAARTDATDDEPSDATGTGTITHGDWDGAVQDDWVRFNGLVWERIPAAEGLLIYVKDTDKLYLYTTDWTAVETSASDANGIFDATNDGGTVPTGFDVALTDTLNFDSNTFVIDGTNDKVGIGTALPTSKLHVVGDINISNGSIWRVGGHQFFGYLDGGTNNYITNGNFFGGYLCGTNNTGTSNTGFGWNALEDLVNGTDNTAVGAQALFSIISGSGSTAIGDRAGLSSTGSDNVFMGKTAGLLLTGGNDNIVIGCDTLGASAVSPTRCTILGDRAGFELNSSAADCTFLGANSGQDDDSNTYVFGVGLGSGAIISKSNQMSLGAGVATSSQFIDEYVYGTTDNDAVIFAAFAAKTIVSKLGRSKVLGDTDADGHDWHFKTSTTRGAGTHGKFAWFTPNEGTTGTAENAPVKRMEIDTPQSATETSLLLFDFDNGTTERVTVGAADSGGVGFKVLRIAN